jgi:hypothetical protein
MPLPPLPPPLLLLNAIASPLLSVIVPLPLPLLPPPIVRSRRRPSARGAPQRNAIALPLNVRPALHVC